MDHVLLRHVELRFHQSHGRLVRIFQYKLHPRSQPDKELLQEWADLITASRPRLRLAETPGRARFVFIVC